MLKTILSKSGFLVLVGLSSLLLSGCGKDEAKTTQSIYDSIQGDHVIEDSKTKWLVDSRPESNGYVDEASARIAFSIGNLNTASYRIEFRMKQAGSRVRLNVGCREDKSGGVVLNLMWTAENTLVAFLTTSEAGDQLVAGTQSKTLDGIDAQGGNAILTLDFDASTARGGTWTLRDVARSGAVIADWQSTAAVGQGDRSILSLTKAKGGVLEYKATGR